MEFDAPGTPFCVTLPETFSQRLDYISVEMVALCCMNLFDRYRSLSLFFSFSAIGLFYLHYFRLFIFLPILYFLSEYLLEDIEFFPSVFAILSSCIIHHAFICKCRFP